MEPLKVLFLSSEVAPFEKTGGLADVAGILPKSLAALGCDVKVFTPYYRHTKNKEFGISRVKTGLQAVLNGRALDFSLYHCEKDKTGFYFIERDEYFDRDLLYGTPSGDYPDNAARFAFFCKAVLKSAEGIGFDPDIIHCNDWQTALVPFYLRDRRNGPSFNKAKILFTVHNLAYQGLFPKEVMGDIDIGEEFFNPAGLEFYGKVSFMKSGIIYSDAISTVSKGYAREILTKEFGCGLEGLLKTRRKDLFGILNGGDYGEWNPACDKFIKKRYDQNSLDGKRECKEDLLIQMGLPQDTEAPLLGIVSRLAWQKGIDIIAESAPLVVKMGCRLVILGAGEEKYHKLLNELAGEYPEAIAVKIAFDNSLAHKIEAGSDMFIMPSRYEPCGLNQMYSLKYGTIPVVRAVGGLDDTIVDYTRGRDRGNGFRFSRAASADFIKALKRALALYKDRKKWQTLTIKAMGFDFSWDRSAEEYITLYKKMIKKGKDERSIMSRIRRW